MNSALLLSLAALFAAVVALFAALAHAWAVPVPPTPGPAAPLPWAWRPAWPLVRRVAPVLAPWIGARHRERLRWCYEERNRRAKAAAVKAIAADVRRIRQEYDQPWEELLNSQEADRHAFRRNEATLLGRAYNVLRYTDWKAVFAKQHDAGGQGPSLFSRAFNTLSDSGHRQQVLALRQQDEQSRLREQQRRQEKLAKNQINVELSEEQQASRVAYARKAEAMKERQNASKQHIRLQQQELTQERNAELRAYRARGKALKAQRAHDHASRTDLQRQETIGLTRVANKAFSVSSIERSGGDSNSIGLTAGKPKRTRKRKDPSERTNRRHTAVEKMVAAPLNDEAAWQRESWDEPVTDGFDRSRKHDKESGHER